MNNAIEILKASKYYSDFLDSFSVPYKLHDVNLNDTIISEAIYYHIFKMKLAGWRHKERFKRKRKHYFSDIFQDIVAFYLKASLPESYEVELETKKGKTQPDIAIKQNNKYVFIIETKTTIGWDRPDKKASKPFKKMEDRINELSTNFEVSKENIIYIFEKPSNVSKNFTNKFWNNTLQEPQPRPTEFPYSKIFPLFNAKDPEGKEISYKEIQSQAKHALVTPFEEIVKLIMRVNKVPEET